MPKPWPQIINVLPQEIQEHVVAEKPEYTNKLRRRSKDHKEESERVLDDDEEEIKTRMGLRYLFNGFRVLGVIWPKSYKVPYVIWSVIINLWATIWLPTGFVVGCIIGFKKGNEIGVILTALQVAINVVGSSVKFILMIFLLPQLKDCEPVMERLDKRCKTREERDIIRRFVKGGNRFVILFTLSYWSYSSSTAISAVIFNRLPYNIYNPFVDAKKSLAHYILAVAMEMIPMDIVCFQEVVDDSYAVIYVNMLRAHLEALILRIERMQPSDGGQYNLEQNLEELKLFIKDHKNIIELYERVSPVISITLFVQFAISAALLGITLINILIFATNIASIVASCFYIVAVVVEISPLCYYTQCLMEENERLARAIFHSNWVDQDVRYRKMLVFFMQRSQKNLEFSAGKLFPITLSSFLSIAKFSFSLYTLINGMHLKERYGL